MLRKYNKTDFNEISTWFQDRKIAIQEDYLSKTGFIVPDTAAGFLYRTDANFCIFECFIGNPKKTSEERDAALNSIVAALIGEAKEMGFKEVYGFATSQSMIRRGFEQGFKQLETCTMIVKDLRS